jgi:FixJ family two-component response regulator
LQYPTVMLTGTGSEVAAVEAMNAGAQAFLMKRRLNPEALHRTP